ncbi:MAG: hypothetical protein Fur0032_19280 [Terrimicrobiaceae bacterium]
MDCLHDCHDVAIAQILTCIPLPLAQQLVHEVADFMRLGQLATRQLRGQHADAVFAR